MHSKWKPHSNLAAMVGRNFGVSAIGMLAVTVPSSFILFRLAKDIYVRFAYGRAAWDAGLRITDKHGHLSDGTSISEFGQVIVDGGGFLMTAAVCFGSVVAFAYLMMRVKGERLGEQLGRWRNENQIPQN